MINVRIVRRKPLLHWSAFSRIGLALVLSAVIWALVLGITHSS